MCRQIEIKTVKATLLAVELPEGSESPYSIETDQSIIPYGKLFRYYTEWRGLPQAESITLPEGNWQHIGTIDKMTEEDWKGIVKFQTTFRNNLKRIDYMFEDYENSDHPFEAITFETATESGLSLLKANKTDEFDQNRPHFFIKQG